MAKTKTTSKIPVQNCQFVLASDLFDGIGTVWDVFCNTDPSCSWGDNNHSLLRARHILSHLDNCDFSTEDVDSDTFDAGMEVLKERVNTLLDGEDTYVDLEN